MCAGLPRSHARSLGTSAIEILFAIQLEALLKSETGFLPGVYAVLKIG